MTRRTWKMGAVLAALTSIAAFSALPETASALPPRCTNDPASCPEPPNPPGEPTDPGYPEPQPKPPLPYRDASDFTYANFALGADVDIVAKLGSPPPEGSRPWPLAIPYTPEISGAPVSVTQVGDNLWAFASYDAGGMASLCVGICSDTPEVVLNSNYGLYQATLQMRPRLDIEFWRVLHVVITNEHGVPISEADVADFVTEATATLHTRAFAECNHWENGNATLNAKSGVDDVTIQRDTSVFEDLVNFVLPGYTAAQNRDIRTRLSDRLGVGHFADIPGSGTRCHTLGVRDDAATGAIIWNEEQLPVNSQ